MTAALVFAAGLIVGVLSAYVAIRTHHHLNAGITADTRAAFVDDAAELAIDEDAETVELL